MSTLGALLYRDTSKPRVSEGAWVALVAAIAAKDLRAMHMLYERMHGFVFTIAVRVSRNRATAEEIVVDVFHEVWQRADRYNQADGTVVGWVMNLTRSRAIDRLRHDTRKKRVAVAETLEVSERERDPIELRQNMALVREAVSSLAAEERTAIELAYFSDSSYVEVARRLDVPLGTVKSRIRSGLAKLRCALSRKGFQ